MATRTRVLLAFKEIHRTCQSAYAGDRQALRASRWKINTEFKRFKDESQPKKIEDHIQLARDASRLVRLSAEEGSSAEECSSNMYESQTMSRKSLHSETKPHRNFQAYNRSGNNTHRDYRERQHQGYDRSGNDTHRDYRERQHHKYDRFGNSTNGDYRERQYQRYDRYGSNSGRDYGDKLYEQNQKMDHYDGDWGDDYPGYNSRVVKPWSKKKPRHVDSANVDLSLITGKR